MLPSANDYTRLIYKMQALLNLPSNNFISMSIENYKSTAAATT